VQAKPVPSKSLGATLRGLREAAGLPRSVLARRIGVDPSALYQMESRGTNPSFILVVKIARALGLPLEDVAAAALGRNVSFRPEATTVKAAQALHEIEKSVERTRKLVGKARANLAETAKQRQVRSPSRRPS
jgi:transcriptional regulator with XRE-family HTH domain